MRIEVGPVESLRPGDRVVIEAEGRRVAVFNDQGTLRAIDDACAHKGSTLADGVVRNGVVTCAAHLWRFDLATGARIDAPGYTQETFSVTTEDDVVVVDIPEQAPQLSVSELMRQHAREWKREP